MDTKDKKENKGQPCETVSNSVQELANSQDLQSQNAKQGG